MNDIIHKATTPGVEIFSDEWFNITLNKSGPLANAAKRICKDFSLGNSSDPEIVYDRIMDSIVEYLRGIYKVPLETGDGIYHGMVSPHKLVVDLNGFQSVQATRILGGGMVEFAPREVIESTHG